MELRHLRYFLAIAETGSFTRAAHQLHLTQPALSRQIGDLESDIEQLLLTRTRNGASLTSAGQALVPLAQKLIADAASIRAKLQRGARRRQRIVIGHSCGFDTDANAIILAKNSVADIELQEFMPRDALDALKREEVQAVIAVRPSARLVANLIGRELWRIAPHVVLPAGHALASRKRVPLAELAHERWGIWDLRQFPGYTDAFTRECRRAGFRPKVVRHVTSVGDIMAHVRAGAFVSFVAAVIRKVPHPGVHIRPLDIPFERRPVVALLWDGDRTGVSKALEPLAKRIAEQCEGKDG